MSAILAERLTGVTTLCTCWKLVSADGGKTVRATDHDRSVVYRSETYEPGLALESSTLRQTLTLAPEPLDLSGALQADGLLAADLRAGVWDGARVSVFRVDWQAPAFGQWLWSGFLSEIEEQGGVFSVRLASNKAMLERTIGRIYGRRCDAGFGDGRCGVDVENAPQSTCDKRFSTCRNVFSNSANFRGFPHMPGNDAVISGPGDHRDGGSRGIET